MARDNHTTTLPPLAGGGRSAGAGNPLSKLGLGGLLRSGSRVSERGCMQMRGGSAVLPAVRLNPDLHTPACRNWRRQRRQGPRS